MKKIMIVALVFSLSLAAGAFAKTYRLNDGTVINGRIVSTNGNNVVIEDERGNTRFVSIDMFEQKKTESGSAQQESVTAPEGAGDQAAPSYKFFAIGLSVTDLLLGALLTGGEATAFYTMTEFALWKHIGLQIDIGVIMGERGLAGLQIGGGLRWYFSGQGVQKYWLGAYYDAFTTVNGDGSEFAVITGYKFAFGAFFIDPYAGLRILSLEDEGIQPGIRWGCNIGLCF